MHTSLSARRSFLRASVVTPSSRLKLALLILYPHRVSTGNTSNPAHTPQWEVSFGCSCTVCSLQCCGNAPAVFDLGPAPCLHLHINTYSLPSQRASCLIFLLVLVFFRCNISHFLSSFHPKEHAEICKYK